MGFQSDVVDGVKFINSIGSSWWRHILFDGLVCTIGFLNLIIQHVLGVNVDFKQRIFVLIIPLLGRVENYEYVLYLGKGVEFVLQLLNAGDENVR